MSVDEKMVPTLTNSAPLVILHDATLDRITNARARSHHGCGPPSPREIRTDVGGQRLIRLSQSLLSTEDSVGRSFTLEIKVSPITLDAQAEQLWDAIRNSKVQLEATSARLAALDTKIKKLDAADPKHKISYALITSGAGGWPSVSTIKEISTLVTPNSPSPQMSHATVRPPGSRKYLSLFAKKRVPGTRKWSAWDRTP